MSSAAALIDRITDAKLAEGVTNATVNRMLEVLRAILRKCVNEWEWLDRAPQVRMLKEPTRRIRFLTREEALKLLDALPDTSGRHGGVQSCNWTATRRMSRVAVDAVGFSASVGVDSSRPGEGA